MEKAFYNCYIEDLTIVDDFPVALSNNGIFDPEINGKYYLCYSNAYNQPNLRPNCIDCASNATIKTPITFISKDSMTRMGFSQQQAQDICTVNMSKTLAAIKNGTYEEMFKDVQIN